MNIYSAAHIICYFITVIVLFSGIYGGNELLFFIKPLSSLGLIFLFFEEKSKVSSFYPFVILIIMINDAFILQDFETNFRIVGILLPSFYLLNIYLLTPYIHYKNFQIKKLLSLPVVVTIFLIVYLTISILNMVFTKLEESVVFVILILVSLFSYLIACFLVYLQNNYTHTMYLFISASGSIFVNAMVPIHELYLPHNFFAAILNVIDFISLFLFLKFLICAKVKSGNIEEARFF